VQLFVSSVTFCSTGLDSGSVQGLSLLGGTKGEQLDQLRKDVITFAPGKGKCELRKEQAVGSANIVATARDGEGEVTLSIRQCVKGGRQTQRTIRGGSALFFEQGKNFSAEHVEAEEAQIETGAQTRDDQLLLGDGRRGFFENGFDLVNRLLSAHQPSADRAVGRELAFAGGLDGGDRGVFGGGDLKELSGATLLALSNVQVIADEMQKRFVADELAPAEDRVSVTAGRGLRNEANLGAERSACIRVGVLIARTDNDRELLDAGAGGFFEYDLEGGFRFAARIDQRLKREGALTWISRSNKGFANFHWTDRKRSGSQSAATGEWFNLKCGKWVTAGVSFRDCLSRSPANGGNARES
jgi:hypothetical protein